MDAEVLDVCAVFFAGAAFVTGAAFLVGGAGGAGDFFTGAALVGALVAGAVFAGAVFVGAVFFAVFFAVFCVVFCVVFCAGVAFAGVVLLAVAAFFVAAFFAGVFFAGAFVAGDFLAAGAFFVGDFLAGDFAGDAAFVAADFFAAAFFAGAVVFFAVVFFAGAVDFFAVDFFAGGALFAAFFVGAAFFSATVLLPAVDFAGFDEALERPTTLRAAAPALLTRDRLPVVAMSAAPPIGLRSCRTRIRGVGSHQWPRGYVQLRCPSSRHTGRSPVILVGVLWHTWPCCTTSMGPVARRTATSDPGTVRARGHDDDAKISPESPEETPPQPAGAD